MPLSPHDGGIVPCRFPVGRSARPTVVGVAVGEFHPGPPLPSGPVISDSAAKRTSQGVVDIALAAFPEPPAVFGKGRVGPADGRGGLHVEERMGKDWVLDEDDRRVRTAVSENAIERKQLRLGLFDRHVGNEVENEDSRIHFGRQVRDPAVQLPVAAETQIDRLAVQTPGEDIRTSHPRTG